MSELSINANLRFRLGGIEVDAPKEWEDITFEASFVDGNNQPTITTDSFTFFDDGANLIKEHVSNGRIFEGLDFIVESYNIEQQLVVFNGIINFTNGYEELEDGSVRVRIQKLDGIDNLNERLSGITLSYLESVGVFNSSEYSDCKYVVEKPINLIELIISNVVIFIMVQQLQQQIAKTAESISTAASILSAGLTGSIGAAIYAVSVAIIQVIYTAIILVAILKLAQQLFSSLLPLVRTHKTLNYRTALTNISRYLGYQFESPIIELDRYYYLPSNINVDDVNDNTGFISFPKGTRTGIPNPNDYGYTASEFFDLCKTMFNAKIRIVDNRLIFRSKNDPFWKQTTTYKLTDILLPIKQYNTDKIMFSRLIQFQLDSIADLWTVKNYKGTNYEIITQDNTINNRRKSFVKGQETINIPVALGNRKQSLSAIEKSLAEAAGVIDSVVNVFGAKSNLKGQVKNRIGVLKVGTNNHTVAKVLYLNPDGSIPQNHRDLLSAKYLWNKYINEKSLVSNNFIRQKAIYQVENAPFGFNDLIKTIENSNFVTSSGEFGEFTNINWNISKDVANLEFEIEQVYTENLTETYIEQE